MRQLRFTPEAWDDFEYWQTQDKKTLRRIQLLVKEILRTPFAGTGKPEPLRYSLANCWSRRIDDTHRIVYQVQDDAVLILQLRYHYTR